MFNFFTHRFSALTLTAILAACGGGGSDLSTDQTTKTTSLSGAVMDGYLTGASVCLDLNANLACDSGEPTTTSGTNGQYTLAVPVGTDTSNLHVIAIVDSKTIDADTGKAPEKSYTLMAPATAAGVVSPLTTLISHNKKRYPALTLDEATAATVADLSLPADTDLKQNYISTKKTDLHQVAQLTAALLGQGITGVVEAASPKTSDAKREAVLLGMDKAKERAKAYAKKVYKATTADTAVNIIKEAMNISIADAETLQKNVASNIEIKNAPYADLASIYKAGLYEINDVSLNENGTIQSLRFSLLTLNASNQPVTTTYELQSDTSGNKQWKNVTILYSSTDLIYLKDGKWANENSDSLDYQLSSDGKTASIKVNGSTIFNAKISYKELNIGDKIANAIQPLVNACTEAYVNCQVLSEVTFKTNSKLFDPHGYIYALTDYYEYSSSRCTQYLADKSCALKTIQDLIGSDKIPLNDNYISFTLDTGSENTGVVLFYAQSDSKYPLGEGKFSISTIDGKRILTIDELDEKVILSIGKLPLYSFFIEHGDSSLVEGSFWPKGSLLPLNDSSSSVYMNREGITSLFGNDLPDLTSIK